MNDKKLLDQAFAELINGKNPTSELPSALHSELLKKIASFNSELIQTISKIFNGQPDSEQAYTGTLAGAVNSLQTDLKHLTLQTSAAANGNLTQKIAFMGELASSFNKMINTLHETQRTIEYKNQKIEKTMPGEIALSNFTEVELIYYPLHRVSGDFVFTCHGENRQFSAFLGDASGHGIAAALITIITKIALETILPKDKPDEVMRELNSLLAVSVPEGMYLTGVLIEIRPDGKAMMANAAHPAALIQRADTGLIEEFSGTGLALGMFEDEIEKYTTTKLSLNRSDRIFLFSDGLLEMKTDNCFLEIAGIKDILSHCHQTNASLTEAVQAIESFVKKASEHCIISDDLTVLAIEYTGPRD